MEVIKRTKSKASPKRLLIDGQIITDKLQMINTFNKYFTSIGQYLTRQLPSATQFIPPNPLTSLPLQFPVVTAQFVEKQLLSMPNNKDVGLDRLPGRLLSAAAPVIAHPLAYIGNMLRSYPCSSLAQPWREITIDPYQFCQYYQMFLNNLYILPSLYF